MKPKGEFKAKIIPAPDLAPGTKVCTHCGQVLPLTSLTAFNGELLCSDCLAELTIACSWCGDRIWRDDNFGTGDTPLCRDCYDDHYTSCSDCGRLIRQHDAFYFGSESDDEPYCLTCYQRRNQRSIHDYYYKPEPLFRGEGPRYFGVELEIDEAGEDCDNADDILDIANWQLENVYCKHDGSLDDGFEIVTHPMSLAYHQNEMPWLKVLGKAQQLGYRSHQASTCGLHVHVSRKAFGDTEAQQDASIARVLYFIEKHWNEMLKFSRRTQRQLDQWAARYGYKDHPKEMLETVKKGGGRGRYSCVNLENYDTIEFRIFRGTLKYNTLIATLQMVNRICDVAISMSDDEIRNMSWSTFVSGCTQPELVQYLKERRLYVNEPVESEVDL